VVALCNRLGRPVVAGGPYPTSSHDEITGVDHFVVGEAEGLIAGLLADLGAGRAARVYRSAGWPDITATPAPRFELLELSAYSTMALQYSRGCPHQCEFCDVVEMFGHLPRTKSVPQFLAELDRLRATGYRGSLFVVDDNFIGNRRRVAELLPAMAAWQRRHGQPFSFFTQTTLRLAADEELLRLMVAAGFNAVFLGIETPVPESLREAHKTQNLALDMVAAVRCIQRHGLEVSAGFIVGFDNDPEDVFGRQRRFIEEAGIPEAMVGLLTALPKTRLHRRLAAEGRLRAPSTGNVTHELSLTFEPKMDERRLLDGYKRLLAELYEPAHYFERCLTLLRNLEVHGASARSVGTTELRALAHSVWRQGVSRYARAYWTYLARAVIEKPRLLPEALAMAVKGHHYFTMTEVMLAKERAPGAARGHVRRAGRWVGQLGERLGRAGRYLPTLANCSAFFASSTSSAR